jgi:hypothetical protein
MQRTTGGEMVMGVDPELDSGVAGEAVPETGVGSGIAGG